MTPKESAKVIFGVLHDDWFSWTPEVVEAFSMAISALKKQEGTPDPWDGEKPHAPDGFVKKYCEPYTEEEA